MKKRLGNVGSAGVSSGSDGGSKKNAFAKGLSMLLSAILVVALVPIIALAQDGSTPTAEEEAGIESTTTKSDESSEPEKASESEKTTGEDKDAAASKEDSSKSSESKETAEDSAEPAKSAESTEPTESTEPDAAAATAEEEPTAASSQKSVSTLAISFPNPGVAAVETWVDLRNAILEANSGKLVAQGSAINTIVLANDITSTNLSELPEITRSLKIDGNGHTLNFGTIPKEVNAFYLGHSPAGGGTFELVNISITRTTANFAVGSKDYGRNWTINIADVKSNGKTSGLLRAAFATVNISGTNTWHSADKLLIGKKIDFAPSSQVNFTADENTVVTVVGGSEGPTGAYFRANPGAVVNLVNNHANSTTDGETQQCVWFKGIRTNDFFEVNGATVTGVSNGSASTGNDAGVYNFNSGNDTRYNLAVNIVNGGKLYGTSNGRMAALTINVNGGTFNLRDAGSLLELTSNRGYFDYQATLRFRDKANQTFNVSNGAVVRVTKLLNSGASTASGFGEIAAIRFGDGGNNAFNVSTGGKVYVENWGTGSPKDPGDPGVQVGGENVAIESAANNFTFNVSGDDSIISLIAHNGAAFNAGTKGNIKVDVTNGANFLAYGKTASDNSGTFKATGTASSFNFNSPRYYDFRNNRAGGGLIFQTGSSSTITSTNSDLAVWEKGSNLDGKPFFSISKIDYVLSGTNFSNVVSFKSYVGNFATLYGSMTRYSRMSGNNAAPILSGIVDGSLTNADKYVRAFANVPEGLNAIGRPAWDDEVWGNFVKNGTTKLAYKSIYSENVYEQEKLANPLSGVLRAGDGSYLVPGDKYKLDDGAYRGAEGQPTYGHPAVNIPTNEVEVLDVTPPAPAAIVTPELYVSQTSIAGNWANLNSAYDDDPTAVEVWIDKGAGAPTLLSGTTTRLIGGTTHSGTWDVTLPTGALAIGDRVYIVLVDKNDHRTPFTEQKVRDAVFAAAPYLTVEADPAPVYTGVLTGIAFADSNHNGVRDSGESLLADVPVTIKIWNGATYVPYTPRPGDNARTDSTGTYTFYVSAGLYSLEVPTTRGTQVITTSGIDYFPINGLRENIAVWAGPGVQTISTSVGYAVPKTNDRPVITFTQKPLVISQTPFASNKLSDGELKAFLQVTDTEDYPAWRSDPDGRAQALYKGLDVTAYDLGGATTIDTANIGVYRVKYVATDSNGNQTTAYRAVVIDDGRYIIADENKDGLNDIVIGARDFVVQQSAVQAIESHVKSLSYAEAFDAEGNALPVGLAYGIPAGYTTHTAAPGPYNFSWKVAGYNTIKAITGLVVIADVLDPGNKDSQYAIYASHFLANTAEALQILLADSFVAKANAHVVKLVSAAPNRGVYINDRGGFKPELGSYPITFTIDGIPLTSQKAQINGVVSNGQTPILNVATPINIWVGPAAAKPAGAIDPFAYSDLYRVSATDPDGGGKGDPSTLADDVPLDILSAVKVTPVGAAVDTTKVGQYVVHFSVTDADNNTVTTDRLVLVNDGRYTVGNGRVLFAKPFVIALDNVPGTEAAKLWQVRGNTQAKLTAGSNESSTVRAGDVLPLDQISFPSLGGYGARVDVYNIAVNGIDFPSYAPRIARTVSAEVVDVDVIVAGPYDEEKDTYYVFGNNITLTPREADTIQSGTAAQQRRALIAALGAGARKTNADGTLSTLGVNIINDDGFFGRATGAQGNYKVSITDEHGVQTAVLNVSVASGNAPIITAVPKPLVFDITSTPGTLTSRQLLRGVTATDVEDDRAGIPLNISIVGGNPNIATNKASVTKVTYSVTDSAGNTATTSRAVIINDGSYVFDNRYILRANSFLIERENVSTTNRPGQIKALSNAQAWDVDGNPVAANRIIIPDEGGYQPVIGDYAITLSLLDDATLQRHITAKVVGDKVIKNGDLYSILASPFVINVIDANALAAGTQNAIESAFVKRAGVESYKRSGNLSYQEGTKSLVSAVKQGSAQNFAGSYGLVEGDKFNVTFWVDEDHTAVVTVVLTISNRFPPVLTVPVYKTVPLNAPFLDGAPTDTVPSYLQGVSVTDSEDGPALTVADVKYNKPVDTSKDKSIYNVNYNVTDSDHNRADKTGVVLVGDWVITDGYAISANNFIKTLSAVNGTEAEVLSASQAKAVDLRPDLAIGTPNPNFGKEVKVVVTNDGGYYGKTSSAGLPNGFEITLAVDEKRSVTKVINARVDDDRAAVTYFANGGVGIPPVTKLYVVGSQATAEANTLARTGYTFGGWALTSTGAAAYQPGNVFTVTANANLYAVWDVIPVATPQGTPPVVATPKATETVTSTKKTTKKTVNNYNSTTSYVPTPYGTQAGVAGPAVEEEPEEKEVVPEVIPNTDIPLMSFATQSTWSILNLACALLLVLLLLVTFIRFITWRDKDAYEYNASKRNWAAYVLLGVSALATTIGLILFAVTQDISGSPSFMDAHSSKFVALALVGAITAILLFINASVARSRNDRQQWTETR